MKQEVDDRSSGSMSDVWTASFGEMDAILSSLYDVESAKRTAFQARLKHFLKIGALPDTKKGRGRAASYSAGDVITMAVLCDITKSGINPEHAVHLVRFDESAIAAATSRTINLLYDNEIENLDDDLDQQVVMFFIPNYITNLVQNDGVKVNILLWGNYRGFVDHILSMSCSSAWRQIMFINFTSLLRALITEIDVQGGAVEEFLGGASAWIDNERSKNPDHELTSTWGNW